LAVLYVGRLEKRKGVRYLLAAFAEVQKGLPEAQLWIAGDGPERSMLESRVRQLKLRRVKFFGAVPDREKRDLLARCGLFTSPALYGESFGVVLLEAMAAGVPVVAGDNSGYRSVLTGTGRLSLADPKLRGEYSRRLVLMLTDNKLRTVWQEWAAAEIGKYDFGPIVDSYEQLYHQLVPVR
jgi:phosphatidylinositol alpha-mannosyltransferase